MSEERQLVEVRRVDMRCDACGIGLMEAGDITYSTNPPMYPHRCPKCGHGATYYKRYPFIEHVVVPTPPAQETDPR